MARVAVLRVLTGGKSFRGGLFRGRIQGIGVAGDALEECDEAALVGEGNAGEKGGDAVKMVAREAAHKGGPLFCEADEALAAVAGGDFALDEGVALKGVEEAGDGSAGDAGHAGEGGGGEAGGVARGGAEEAHEDGEASVGDAGVEEGRFDGAAEFLGGAEEVEEGLIGAGLEGGEDGGGLLEAFAAREDLWEHQWHRRKS
jgi:hypothetical protein